MNVVVAGGHGKVGVRLLARLVAAGHGARGLVRRPEQAMLLDVVGADAAMVDLESDQPLAPALEGADAVVFSAGAGAGSGDERKRTVDLGAAVKLMDAAKEVGIRRYVMVSSVFAHDPENGPEALRPYLRAKAEADQALMATDLAWTIVRPGRLTDEPATGLVDVSTEFGRREEVTRNDVAAVLYTVLGSPHTVGVTFELFNGDVPVAEAVAGLKPAG